MMSFHSGGTAIKEFGPKTGRACNDLAWNPKFTNYIAAGYEKNRSDSCILIFDTSLKSNEHAEAVNTTQASSTSSNPMSKIVSKPSTTSPAKDLIRASIELGIGESCNRYVYVRWH